MLPYFRLRKDYVRPILLTFKHPDKEELVCIDLLILILYNVLYIITSNYNIVLFQKRSLPLLLKVFWV